MLFILFYVTRPLTSFTFCRVEPEIDCLVPSVKPTGVNHPCLVPIPKPTPYKNPSLYISLPLFPFTKSLFVIPISQNPVPKQNYPALWTNYIYILLPNVHTLCYNYLYMKHEYKSYAGDVVYITETKKLSNGYFLSSKMFEVEEGGNINPLPISDDWIILPFDIAKEIYKELGTIFG